MGRRSESEAREDQSPMAILRQSLATRIVLDGLLAPAGASYVFQVLEDYLTSYGRQRSLVHRAPALPKLLDQA